VATSTVAKPSTVDRRVSSVVTAAALSVSQPIVHDLPQALDVESLFRAHYGRLVRALTVVCGNRETAADAVQEAFVKAHLKWRVVSHYDDPVGWIRRVAINKLRDEHRRLGRRDRLVERLGGEPTLSLDEPQLDELGKQLAGLPRQQRIAVALFYVDQLTVAEIADALGISTGAVKFHLHQGRERLRGSFAEQGGVG
jgi:RNA polymerase sigma-70 factor, ECF subfamily